MNSINLLAQANPAKDGVDAVTVATRGVWDKTLYILGSVWNAVDDYVLAAIIFFLGWLLANFAAKLIKKGLSKTEIDNKLGGYLGLNGEASAENFISKFVKYFILLVAFIAALNAAKLGSDVTAPFSGMLAEFLDAIPNVLKAGILLLVTVIIAKVAKGILSTVLSGARLDERLGMGERKPITNALCTIVYFLIILLMLPAIFSALALPTISEPLVQITQQITAYFPKVLAGAAILGVGYLLGSIAQKIIYSLLNAIGFDTLPSKIGYEGKMQTEGIKSPSGVVSYIVMVSIIVIASTEAFNAMQLDSISGMAQEFRDGFFSILGGVIILGIGIFVANWVAGLLDDRSATLAKVARIAIIIFAAAMAISQADIAPEISQTLFIAIIVAGAFALGVGGAIALGLGGRERAKEVVDQLGK